MSVGDRPGMDIADRVDVEVLLRRFYSRVFADDVLPEPFAELRVHGLDSHLPVMCDFWETVLFGAGLYHGSALQVHRQLHDRHPLTAEHFTRWLTLWCATVDQMAPGTCRRKGEAASGQNRHVNASPPDRQRCARTTRHQPRRRGCEPTNSFFVATSRLRYTM